VLHGTDKDGSDIDILVDALPSPTLFDLGSLHEELETLPGVRVDLLTPWRPSTEVPSAGAREPQPV